MLDLLIVVIFGTAFAFFATQNTGGVDVHLSNMLWSGIPLYLVVLGSMILGLVLASLLHYIDSIFTFFKFQKKNSQIKETSRTVDALEAKLTRLEEENARLRGDKVQLRTEEHIHDKINHPSPLDKLRSRLT